MSDQNAIAVNGSAAVDRGREPGRFDDASSLPGRFPRYPGRFQDMDHGMPGIPPKGLKMKDLEEVSGVNRETIRFYIREGLLPEPERPKRNVATYGFAHVSRLRLIRKLQSERFLPLNVIRTIIHAAEASNHASADAFIGLENRLYPFLADQNLPGPRTLAQAVEAWGVPEQAIRELDAIGLVRIDRTDDGEYLNERNMSILRLWQEFRALGFGPEAGFATELWSIYVEAMRALVAREATLFQSVSVADKAQAAMMAESGIRIINEILPLLRIETLVRNAKEASKAHRLEAGKTDCL
ncbi:MAG: MerR family transcriptional regulator [Parvibaculaceae bacterium]|nr:MerR family transcriptional regulator [Parvibaculaceae bacterium]